MLLSEVEELAAKYGMESCGYNFLDGYLEGVEFQDKKTKKTTMFLEAEFTPEYEEELQELEDGTEYQIDASKCVVTNACVYGPFVNESGFLDGSQNGILLFGKESLEGVNDGMYHHELDIHMLEFCIWIQQHPIQHSRLILEQNLEHIEIIKERFEDVLNEFGFYEELNSFFNLDAQRENTNIEMWYVFDELYNCAFYTDCVTGKLIFDGKDITNMTTDEFREYMMTEVVCHGDGKPRFEFEFIFHEDEPGWNKNTAQNIYQMQHDLKRGMRKEDEVDYNSVPEKYQKMVEEHKQLPIKYYN